ncbi:class I SAM-dependent methyltransferase [Kitasatospora viridis]|uniref:Methyltransferase family protein n=1 Tax=Kitasatospora viridis TaxID=281105 RepID=A0A561TTL1_9ACTN|nr:class I SAM-dependent methyltransferase [Kitasatospora viridis]TWF90462.1 methyltransferase family protein [Kitasatospora viridis]
MRNLHLSDLHLGATEPERPGVGESETPFDGYERRAWAGRGRAYADSFAKLCAGAVPQLLDAAGVGAGDRVLDVGTGPGTVAAAAVARAALVTAVDAEPSMVELAREAVPQAAVRLGTLPELPCADQEFDAVVGNFVLNHVGRPAAALTELRRVVRPGGRIALTIWAVPAAAGQTLLWRAVEAAGVTRPAHLPPLDAEHDFPRTPAGLVALLESAGWREPECVELRWEHRAGRQEWWDGAAAGIGFIGQLLLAQEESVRELVRGHYLELSREFADADGTLLLPHAALLVSGRR